MVKRLGQLGYQVTMLNDLSGGHRGVVWSGDFVQGLIAYAGMLNRPLGQAVDAVINFAFFIQVSESVHKSANNYCNNVVNTLKLPKYMHAHGIHNFIFSSTAATFGDSQYATMDERHSKHPINPYDRSNQMIDEVLADYDAAYRLK